MKFEHQSELDHLIARIFLDTKVKLTKKSLLEIIFKIGIKDYNTLLREVTKKEKTDDLKLREEFIRKFEGVLSVDNPVS